MSFHRPHLEWHSEELKEIFGAWRRNFHADIVQMTHLAKQLTVLMDNPRSQWSTSMSFFDLEIPDCQKKATAE